MSTTHEPEASGIQTNLHFIEAASFTDPETGLEITPNQAAQAWLRAASEGKCLNITASYFSREAIEANRSLADIHHVTLERQTDATLDALIQQKTDRMTVGRPLPDAPINHVSA